MSLAKLAFGFEAAARKRLAPVLTPWFLALPCFMSGILCSSWLEQRKAISLNLFAEFSSFSWLFLSILASILGMFLSRRSRRGVIYWLLSWSLLWHGFGLYFACDRSRAVPDNNAEIWGIVEVSGIVNPSPSGRAVDVKLLAWSANGRVISDGRMSRLWLEDDERPVWGHKYYVKLKYELLEGAEIEGAYDPRQSMRSKGYHFSLKKRGRLYALEYDAGLKDKFLANLSMAREAAYTSLMQSSPYGMQAALALGVGASVEGATREQFARLGLAHILAVSGFHFSILAAVILWLLSKILSRIPWVLRRYSKQRVSAVLALPLLLLYLLYVGAPIPAQRAYIMMSACSFATVFWRKSETMRSMTLAGFVILLREPYAMFSLSFCLSFIAVFGLFWTLQHYDKALRLLLSQRFGEDTGVYKCLYYVASVIIVSLGASVASAPLLVYYFGQIPLSGTICNLWVLPFVSFILLPLAFVCALLAPFAPSASYYLGLVAKKAEQLLVYIVDISDAYLPASHLRVFAWWPIILSLTLFASFCFMPYLRKKLRLRLCSFAFMASVVFIIWGANTQSMPSELLRVSSISVGQADATLIELPDGRIILVDAGSPLGQRQNTAKTRIVPYLSRLRIKYIDTVYLTHPDYDHYAALADIMDKIKIGEIIYNGVHSNEQAYLELLAKAKKAGVPMKAVQGEAAVQQYAGLEIQRLWPPDSPLDPEKYNRNEQSIVLSLSYGGFRMLLMGDAGIQVEEELLCAEPLRSPISVLKAGHHGSASASGEDFIRATRPHYVLYSVGKNNRYRLPHKRVLQRSREYAAKVYRHDEHASVRFTTDGEKLLIETMR
ncbi:MAG: DNA internalization-related competence protein ComEC/Rec2 [Bradymonadia bacterium]|jgi:competence protein ComEC